MDRTTHALDSTVGFVTCFRLLLLLSLSSSEAAAAAAAAAAFHAECSPLMHRAVDCIGIVGLAL